MSLGSQSAVKDFLRSLAQLRVLPSPSPGFAVSAALGVLLCILVSMVSAALVRSSARVVGLSTFMEVEAWEMRAPRVGVCVCDGDCAYADTRELHSEDAMPIRFRFGLGILHVWVSESKRARVCE